MRAWLLVTGLMTAVLAGAPADAWSAERVDAVSASARAEIAAALYAASATRTAAERIADAQLTAARSEIERLRSEGERARTQLVAAQEQYVRDLEARSAAYQEEIAVFRQTVTEIAATPQGRRALQLYADGDPAAGREVLTRLMDTRARAERRAADLRQAVDARRIATLDLDAMKRGNLDTLTVIADFELVTRLDGTNSNDWLELARLYRDAGRLAQSEEAVRRGLEAAQTPAERGRLHLEQASIFARRLDWQGDAQASTDAIAELTAAAAAEPGVASIQRDLLKARLRASDESSADLLNAVREAVAGAPNDLSLQLTHIEALADLAEEAAERDDIRSAIANLDVAMDAIDAMEAPDAERVAIDAARAGVLEPMIELLERANDIEQAADASSLRVNIFQQISSANPASVSAREAHAMALIDYGSLALRYDMSFVTDAGERLDGSVMIKQGVNILRENAAAEPANAVTQLLFAGALLSGGRDWLNASPDSAEAQAMWAEGAAALEALARAHPDRIDLQNAAAGMMLIRIEQEADRAAKNALIAELMPRIRDLARRYDGDPSIQTVYLGALMEQAGTLEGDLRARSEAEREAEAFVRRVSRHAPDHPAGRLAVANLYRGLGTYYLGMNATPTALERYEQAFAIQRAVWMDDPEITVFRDELAADMVRLAHTLYDANDADNGAIYYGRAIDLYRDSNVETGESAAWRNSLLLQELGAYGDLLVARRDWAGAQSVFEERLLLDRRNAETFPDNIYAQRILPRTLANLGRIAREQGDQERAAECFGEALALAQAIADTHHDDADDQRLVLTILNDLTVIAGDGRDAAAMIAYLERSVDMRRRLVSLPVATQGDQRNLARSLLWLGETQQRAQNLDEARRAIDEGVELLRALAAADGASNQAHEDLVEALDTAAALRRTQNDLAGELALRREIVTRRRNMPMEEPRSRYALAMDHFSLALAEERAQHPDRAAANYHEMFDLYRSILTQFPDDRSLWPALVNVMTGLENGDALRAEDREWLAAARAELGQTQ